MESGDREERRRGADLKVILRRKAVSLAFVLVSSCLFSMPDSCQIVTSEIP